MSAGRWPLAAPGMVIGLLGGSFDPAHEGHAAITREALKRFGLDRVWWLVSPGNPLKPDAPAAVQRRVQRARQVMQHPRVDVTAIETDLRSRFTANTVAALVEHYPGVVFVWLMGSDNLESFHRWERWREIAAQVPIGVFARPGHRLTGLAAPAARAMRHARLLGSESRRLPQVGPPAWTFATIPLRQESSSYLRRDGSWKQ